MKRVMAMALGLAFVGAMAVPTLRAQEKTIKGQIVDIKCDMDKMHGPDDACTGSCVKRGQAAGIKTADGAIYEVTGKFAAEKNAKLVEFLSKQLEVTGTIAEKDGKKTIDVTAMKVAK